MDSLEKELLLRDLDRFGYHLAQPQSTNATSVLSRMLQSNDGRVLEGVAVVLTQTLVQATDALKVWRHSLQNSDYVRADPNREFRPEDVIIADDEVKKAFDEAANSKTALNEATAAACLAVSDDLWQIARSINLTLDDAQTQVRKAGEFNKTIEGVTEMITNFTQAAKKELRITIR